MRKKGHFIYIIIFIVISSCADNKGQARMMKADAFEKGVAACRNNCSVLDVRTPEEFKEGYIDGAVNIDFYADDFQDRISSLDPSKTYYVYCRTQNRSGKAAELMQSKGFKEVYVLEGGINKWREENRSLTK
jgi:phage shock protein E